MALANLTAPLANVTVSQLNFSQTCSSTQLALQVYNEFFFSDRSQPLDSSAYNISNPWNDGPTGFASWWNNGPPPAWINFWHDALKTKTDLREELLTDKHVEVWANSTDAFNFFWYPTVYSNDTTWYTNDIALYGGCVTNKTLSLQDISAASYGGYDLNNMIEDCMVLYCCPTTLDSKSLSDPSIPYPYIETWTTRDTCLFHTCQAATRGNPDLAGIGIIVAYYIEGTLLIGTTSMALVDLFIAVARAWRLRLPPRPSSSIMSRFWERHDAAYMCAATVLLDAAVYFSLSVSFAGVWYNYRAKPLLYEDKLVQTSTLLAVNAPVVILLLIYQRSKFERPELRYVLVAATALMALIIQFMFRHASNFDPKAPLCLVWSGDLNRPFSNRFILKAVWSSLVILFFCSHLFPWLLPGWTARLDEALTRFGNKGRRSSSQILSPSYITRIIYLIVVLRRRILAIVLAAYGIFDSFYDIQFIRTLRDRVLEASAQAEVASPNEQDNWGYGQILAVLIWAPILVEYLYVVLKGPEESEEARRQSTPEIFRSEPKYVEVAGHDRSASVGET